MSALSVGATDCRHSLTTLAAMRETVDAWKRNPFFWSTTLGIPLDRFHATIELVDEVSTTAEARLRDGI